MTVGGQQGPAGGREPSQIFSLGGRKGVPQYSDHFPAPLIVGSEGLWASHYPSLPTGPRSTVLGTGHRSESQPTTHAGCSV